MEIMEKIFQKLWTRGPFSQKESFSSISLADHVRYLETIAQCFSSHSTSPKQKFSGEKGSRRGIGDCDLQIVGSRDFVGFVGSTLFLPERIQFFLTQDLNRAAYVNLVLLACGARACGLVHRKKKSSKNRVAPAQLRWMFLQVMPQINSYLDGELSGYSEFQNKIVEASGNLDFEWDRYRARHKPSSQISSGGSSPFEDSKLNEKIPPAFFVLLPCLESSRQSLFVDRDVAARSHPSNQDSKEPKSELKKNYSSVTEQVDLDREQPNPVTHSFEKLETADEYSGGRKFDSSDDELMDHGAALDELNLSKVTTGGEAAQSVYQSENQIYFSSDGAPLGLEGRGRSVLYPEWNFKRATYFQDHCRIVENPDVVSKSTDESRARLLLTYGPQIRHWQRRIESLLTSPLWIRRLRDGDEIDLDGFVRDFGALRSRRDVEGRWYTKRKSRVKEAAVTILFDQSLSSDSWVQNRRVLDVITESIGIAGLLFENVIDSVQVAGTWSATRHHCGYQIYKDGAGPWSEYFQQVDGISPQGYTRLGPAIRHATSGLAKLPHRQKLLLLLTDGKPTDLDGYEGTHGVQDVRYACREAEAQGIVPFAIAIEQTPKRHFPKMFNHYILLQDPKKFSESIFQILLHLVQGRG